MSNLAMSNDRIGRVISQAIRQHVEDLVEAEIEAATTRVRQKIIEAKATVAMAVLKEFDFARNGDRITISVKDTTREVA